MISIIVIDTNYYYKTQAFFIFTLYKEQIFMKTVYNRLCIIFLTFVHTITPSDNSSRSWNNNKQTISIIASGIVAFGLLVQYYFKNNDLTKRNNILISNEQTLDKEINRLKQESQNNDLVISNLKKQNELLTDNNNQLNTDNQLLKGKNEPLTNQNKELQQKLDSMNTFIKRIFSQTSESQIYSPLILKINSTAEENVKKNSKKNANELLTIFNLNNEWESIFNENRNAYCFQKKKK